MKYQTLFSVYKTSFLIFLENLFSRIQIPTSPKNALQYVLNIYEERLMETKEDLEAIQDKRVNWQQIFSKYLTSGSQEVYRFPTLQIKTKEEIETKIKLLSKLINTLRVLYSGKVKTVEDKNIILREVSKMVSAISHGGFGLDQIFIGDKKYIDFAEVLNKESSNLIVEEATKENRFNGILTFSYVPTQG